MATTDLMFIDGNYADTGRTGDYPGCIIDINTLNTEGAGGQAGLISFYGGAIEDQGPHNPMLCINSGAFDTYFDGSVDWEMASAKAGNNWVNVDPVQINNAPNIQFGNMNFDGILATGTGAPTHLVDITGNSGVANNIHIHNFGYFNTWTSLSSAIHNTVDGTDQNGYPRSCCWNTINDFTFNGQGAQMSDSFQLYPKTNGTPPSTTAGQMWFDTSTDSTHFSYTPNGGATPTVFQLANSNDLCCTGITYSTGNDILAGIGNFETGSGTLGTGWGNSGDCSGAFTCVYTRTSATAAVGTYSQEINVTANSSATGGGEANIKSTSTFAVVAGQAYTVQMWARTDGATGANVFWNIAATGGGPPSYCINSILNAALSTTWQLFNFKCTISTTDPAAFIRLGGIWPGNTGVNAGIGAIYIDDFVMALDQPLPPASILSSIGAYSLGPATTAELTTTINGVPCEIGSTCALLLFGTTGTITGTSLSATCDSGTASVTGATVGHAVGVSATDGTDVGGAFDLRASVTSANTVTVYVCGTGTPASKAYNVSTY